MSKRYYLCDIIGTGSDMDPYRPVVADYGVAWVGVIESNPETGAPIHADTLVLVETDNHAKLRADSRIDALSDFVLDGKMNAINSAARTAMSAALSRRKFSASSINNADGYREALQQIGRQRSPQFNIDAFDVG